MHYLSESYCPTTVPISTHYFQRTYSINNIAPQYQHKTNFTIQVLVFHRCVCMSDIFQSESLHVFLSFSPGTFRLILHGLMVLYIVMRVIHQQGKTLLLLNLLLVKLNFVP